MRKSGKAKQLSWDSDHEWPSLAIYNLISACGNEGADFQRPTQGWAQFSISSTFMALKCSQLTRMTRPFLTNQVCSQSKHLSWGSLPLCLVSYSWKITTLLLLCPSTRAQKHWHTSQRWASIELTSWAVSEVTHPQQSEHHTAVLGASLSVPSTTRAAGGAKRKRMIQLLITCATERKNLANSNPASSRFWFSSHQLESNQNREDKNQKGKGKVLCEFHELNQLTADL